MRHANTLTRKVEIFVASCYILSNGLDTSSLVVKQQVERASIVVHTLELEITAQAAEVGGVGIAVGPLQCVGAWPDAESCDCRSDRGRDGIPF